MKPSTAWGAAAAAIALVLAAPLASAQADPSDETTDSVRITTTDDSVRITGTDTDSVRITDTPENREF